MALVTGRPAGCDSRAEAALDDQATGRLRDAIAVSAGISSPLCRIPRHPPQVDHAYTVYPAKRSTPAPTDPIDLNPDHHLLRLGILAQILADRRGSNARSEATNTHLRVLTRHAYGYRCPEALIAHAMLAPRRAARRGPRRTCPAAPPNPHPPAKPLIGRGVAALSRPSR